jgi:hypothetical protein
MHWLLSGNPDGYSDRAITFIQVTIFGKQLAANQDQQGFACPAHMDLIHAPFGLILDVEIATSTWQGLTFYLLPAAFFSACAFSPGKMLMPLVIALVISQYPLLLTGAIYSHSSPFGRGRHGFIP